MNKFIIATFLKTNSIGMYKPQRIIIHLLLDWVVVVAVVTVAVIAVVVEVVVVVGGGGDDVSPQHRYSCIQKTHYLMEGLTKLYLVYVSHHCNTS